MKTKQIFKIIITSVTIYLMTFNLSSAQSSDNGFLMIRVYESFDKGYNTAIVTENGIELETVELKRVYYKDLSESQKTINNLIDKYEKGEYKLKFFTSGSVPKDGYGIRITTYLFKKE